MQLYRFFILFFKFILSLYLGVPSKINILLILMIQKYKNVSNIVNRKNSSNTSNKLYDLNFWDNKNSLPYFYTAVYVG